MLFSNFFYTPLDSLVIRHSNLLQIDLVNSQWFFFLRNMMNYFMNLCQLWIKHTKKNYLFKWVLTQPPFIEIHMYDYVYSMASMLHLIKCCVLCWVLWLINLLVWYWRQLLLIDFYYKFGGGDWFSIEMKIMGLEYMHPSM